MSRAGTIRYPGLCEFDNAVRASQARQVGAIADLPAGFLEFFKEVVGPGELFLGGTQSLVDRCCLFWQQTEFAGESKFAGHRCCFGQHFTGCTLCWTVNW